MSTENKHKGISRREFMASSLAVTTGSVFTDEVPAQSADPAPVRQKNPGVRVVLLGTGGGPSPKKTRSHPAQVVGSTGPLT